VIGPPAVTGSTATARADSSGAPPERRFVFVGGLHRSGTSILFRCLREHPSISGFRETGVPEDEGQHLQTVYPTAMFYGGPGRFGFEPAAHLTEASDLVTEENRRKLFDQWKHHWSLEKSHLLEKSPPNLIQARFLQALFPGASFIMLLRHPVAVSYATQKWSKTPVHSLVRHWLTCHELMEEDRGRLSQVLVLKYEEFVREPATLLSRIFDFLGLADHTVPLDVAPNVNGKYFERWRRNRDRLWLRPYMSRLIRTFEPRVSRFGYSLEDLERA
jgi:sulfotransferase family protein